MSLAMVAVLLLAACAPDPDDSARATRSTELPGPTATVAPAAQPSGSHPANGISASVLSLDNNFLPQVLTIAAGTEVLFENNGRNDHDVTPVGDLERATWGVAPAAFAPTGTYSHVFTQPGRYEYFCTIHGTATAGMIGTIVVTEP
ncbi:MAG TPA: plastocyanin/azurin family copper-binding protein [Ilumatobacteraceae bacterium]|nr:hypothetical protein [Acidimicrobiaceae bacterium]HQY86092.1 plastocyanin/azurin family copper-binding protein [Ilumatobacteraceae bacterium]HRA85741.1 plastocyanin/azurin family copper-binding protein [Ilumatobacteraceae bacterium]HRC47660.1 plastocyanin/azurin family copper-binding protein [Ilumatobacteraceae bacterium]